MVAGDIFERLIGNAQTAAARLIVKSALNPMLWCSAIIGLPCLILAYFAKGTEPLETVLVCLGAGVIGSTVLGFFYFMIFAPQRLQSEEYQIRHETLELIKEKGSSVEIAPSSLEAIANPVHSTSSKGSAR
jgi:hypothetical protein